MTSPTMMTLHAFLQMSLRIISGVLTNVAFILKFSFDEIVEQQKSLDSFPIQSRGLFFKSQEIFYQHQKNFFSFFLLPQSDWEIKKVGCLGMGGKKDKKPLQTLSNISQGEQKRSGVSKLIAHFLFSTLLLREKSFLWPWKAVKKGRTVSYKMQYRQKQGRQSRKKLLRSAFQWDTFYLEKFAREGIDFWKKHIAFSHFINERHIQFLRRKSFFSFNFPESLISPELRLGKAIKYG